MKSPIYIAICLALIICAEHIPCPIAIGRGRAAEAPLQTSVAPMPARTLYDAIRMVESGGDDNAVGDGGKSKGPYQIGRLYWADACEFAGVVWDYDTLVWERAYCEQVMDWYFARYGAVTNEQKARCHNSGPRWKSKYHLTDGYWAKVQKGI